MTTETQNTPSTTESALSKVTPSKFAQAWRDYETVSQVAKHCGISKDEARALAAALRGAGVKLMKKSRGRKTIVSKREVEILNAMLAGQLTDDIQHTEAQEDDDE